MKMTVNDMTKLNENYQFVTEYIEKFIIKMTDSGYSKRSERIWHIKNHINYILSISYAFLGRMDAYWYRAQLLECQPDTNIHNVSNIDLMIKYGLKMRPNCNTDGNNAYEHQRQLLKHLQHIILNDKTQSKNLHENNLISMGYVHQNHQLLNQVLNEATRDEKLYLKWKKVTCLRICNTCGRHREKMYRCKNCRVTLYCSKRCQKSDWNGRKHWCTRV